MAPLVAALPMYDWPETRAQTDRAWEELRKRLLAYGIEAPPALARRNSDLPAVPGGIRDGAGSRVAPDPATLDPSAFDLPVLWRHPQLLFAQTCWGPMEEGLEGEVIRLAQPDYSAYEGGEGTLYSSAIVMREPLPGNRAPRLGEPGTEMLLEWLRGKVLAFNGPDSMSGIKALARDLEALGPGLSVFARLLETGAHRASIRAVAAGEADVCAIDCRSWSLAKLHEPAAADVTVVGWTRLRPGLPFIASRHLPSATIEILRSALQAPSSLASSG